MDQNKGNFDKYSGKGKVLKKENELSKTQISLAQTSLHQKLGCKK